MCSGHAWLKSKLLSIYYACSIIAPPLHASARVSRRSCGGEMLSTRWGGAAVVKCWLCNKDLSCDGQAAVDRHFGVGGLPNYLFRVATNLVGVPTGIGAVRHQSSAHARHTMCRELPCCPILEPHYILHRQWLYNFCNRLIIIRLMWLRV